MDGGAVAITGGLGFIGSHLGRALEERGERVIRIDRRPGGVRLDVSRDPLDSVLGGARAVVHLAGLPGVRAGHGLAELWRHNVVGTRRVVEAAGRHGVPVVVASSSSVYGDAVRLPAHEELPPSPLGLYALSKLAAEQVCRSAARGGAHVVIARLFTVFGPHQRRDMALGRWIEAVAAGRPVRWCAPRCARRELTYVDDAARGLLAALERGRPGEAYNLPGVGSVPLSRALAEVERAVGRGARLRVLPPSGEDAVATAACGRKAAAEFGYEARVDLRLGIERQVRAALGRPAPAGLPAAA
jgi:nucleoside-diphosphate-sugar epimerase